MWRKLIIAAAVFVSSFECHPALGQVITNIGPLTATILSSGQTNHLLVYSQAGNISVFLTNAIGDAGRRDLQTGAWTWSLKPTSPSLPKPGIYKTEPYACIVIVPGKQPDDRSVLKPTGPAAAMPSITPELRFIPLPSK